MGCACGCPGGCPPTDRFLAAVRNGRGKRGARARKNPVEVQDVLGPVVVLGIAGIVLASAAASVGSKYV